MIIGRHLETVDERSCVQMLRSGRVYETIKTVMCDDGLEAKGRET